MTIDYYSILRKRIVLLDDVSDSARADLYRQLKDQEEQRIAHTFPPMSAMQKAEVRLLLDVAMKRVEAEFAKARKESGLYAPEWVTEGKAALAPPDAAGGSATKDGSAPERPQAGGRPPVVIEGSVAAAAAPKPAAPPRPIIPTAPPKPRDDWDDPVEPIADDERGILSIAAALVVAQVRSLGALLVHAVKTTAGHEKPAFLWLTVEPVMQVGLIVTLYWMFGRTMVYSMPAIPFAIIGVGSWLMFRTSLLRIATGLGREFSLCFFPGITRLHVFIARSLFFGLNYLFATVIMLWLASYFEVAEVELKHPLLFLGYWAALWFFSLGFALLMNYVFVLIPSMRRMTLVLMRGLYLLSAVVAVTEQFAAEDKAFLLWNPLVHGMQLLRSAYFFEYSSDDASPGYFLAATLILLLVGVVSERVQMRRDIRP